MSQQYKLLIIDKDFKTIYLLKRNLEPLNYQIYFAQDVEKAIDMLKNLHIDIVLLDSVVLGPSTMEVLALSKEISPNTIRILMGQTPDINLIINVFNNQLIYNYISKPLKNNEVIELLAKATDYKNMVEEKEEDYKLYNQLKVNFDPEDLDTISKNNEKKENEKRSYFRVKTTIPLCCDMRIMQVKGKAVDTPFTQICVLDTSAGGFRFLSELILPISSEVMLEFRTHILDNVLLLAGHIVRMEQIENDIYEYGVRFNIDETKETQLIRLLNEIQIDIRNNVAIRGCSFCTKANQASCLRTRIKSKGKEQYINK